MTRIQPKTVLLVMVLALALAALLAPAAMAASPYDGKAFGEHVSKMAKKGHLGQDCNPGTHQGITGWHMGDMMPCMPMNPAPAA